jgi:hypothetical protein
MRRAKAGDLPENHPVKRIFHTLAERGLAQASLRDPDILFYIANLLVDFLWVENLYRIQDEDGRRIESLLDILIQANEAEMPEKKEYYRHLGDYSLFMLGMFPESIDRTRRLLSPSWYMETGRAGYQIAGELDRDVWRIQVFRKLADKFDRCVISLHWIREYSTDPFYQWMFREFEIT